MSFIGLIPTQDADTASKDVSVEPAAPTEAEARTNRTFVRATSETVTDPTAPAATTEAAPTTAAPATETTPTATAPTPTDDDDKKEDKGLLGGLGMGNGIGSVLGAILGFMLGNMMGGPMMGMMLALMLGAGGFFAGGAVEENLKDSQTPDITPQEKEARAQGATMLKEIAGMDEEKGKLSTKELKDALANEKGETDFSLTADTLGFNADKNNDRKLDAEELAASDARLKQIAATNPEVAEIATGYQRALQELASSGTRAEDAPSAPDRGTGPAR